MLVTAHLIKDIMGNYYIWDLEVYPNIFTFCGKFVDNDEIHLFEISDRVNHTQELVNFLSYLKNCNAEMVGYNNVGYDYNLLHELIINPYTFTYQKAFQISQQIIKSFGYRNIKYTEREIPQVDIMKFMHFDNKAKITSLKNLQFAMRTHSLEDLPFDIRDLNDQEKNELRKYNEHDVTETENFFHKVKHHLDMRREYLDEGILRGDVLNYSDVKIGVEYLLTRIGKNKCYSGGKPKQTLRTHTDLKDVVLPKIYFRSELYNSVLTWFQTQHWTPKGTRAKHVTDLAGLTFDFGIGGIHASANNKVYKSNDTHQIIDIDVASMYPSVAIANGFAPEHLGDIFLTVYTQIKEDRKRYAKGTSRNAAMKLAGNGAYGNFNNPYSPLYDPNCMLSITINGQLQLLQLIELLSFIPGLEIIQANTDGVTVYIERESERLFKMWCDEWERMTGLILEEVKYSRMWIRDVNNYISEYEDGSLKRKGTYWYPLCEKDYDGWWNKDFSNHASKIAAEKMMTHSWSVEQAIRLVTNPFEFMLRYKATGGAKIFIGETKQLKTVRYYVSTAGEPMKKVAHPKGEIGQFKRRNKLKDDYFKNIMKEIGKDIWDERVHTKNKSKYEIVTTSIQSGKLVKQCNVATDFNWNDVDWNYYIEEAKKIIIGSK